LHSLLKQATNTCACFMQLDYVTTLSFQWRQNLKTHKTGCWRNRKSKITKTTACHWKWQRQIKLAYSPKLSPALAYPEGGLGGWNPPPPKVFGSFDKAEPNSQFRGKYILRT
jgi:hypothetical protein